MERLQCFYNSHCNWSVTKEKGNEKEKRGVTRCLYECLQAVGLQHHYASFTSMGVCRAAHLSALTMEDYPLLGIHTMKDRMRLFHLVQMVKTDFKSLTCEGEDDANDDEGCTAVSSNYSYSRARDDDEDKDETSANANNFTAAGFPRPLHVHRRLDFSSDLLTSPNDPVHEHASHNRERVSQYNSDTGLSLKRDSLHKQTPRPVTATTKRFNNKPAGPKHRKRISRPCEERGSSGTSRHVLRPTPVYQSVRTAGYSDGQPQSSPAVTKRQAGDQRISVCVRKRPLMRVESRRGQADVVTTPGGACVIIHESKEAVDLTKFILQHRFYFDQVFGEDSSNEDVYQGTAYPLVQHMLSGGRATCFAYGQTGAGKTHTMLGSSPTRPGLYALAVRDIFAHLSTAHTVSPLQVYVSFFEIYCGQLYDLLDHRKRLFAREDGQKVVHIAGLHEARVDSVSSLLEVISQGLGERTQGMSGVNPLSSRSHALLQIQLKSENQQIAGRMCFVDLAGSERASDTKEPDRQSRMEGAEINQSLLALKECIRSLDQEQSHTPFRQSRLTQVLKDSFVGNSMTCMIANISPGHLATEHTLNTLRYADRVKELRRQGEVRGGRRGKTMPCPKQNSSSSSGSAVGTRGRSPPKKAKLRQKETPGPTSRTTCLPMGEAILCSTPKTSRCGEETSQRGSKGIGFEHTTPVGGWMGTADKRKGVKTAGKQGVGATENETTDSHFVRWPKGHTELVLGHPCNEGNSATAQRDFVLRQEGRKLSEPQKQVDGSSRSTCREAEVKNESVKSVDEKDKEKQSHLRWYHQQLQQFIPSPASSPSPLFSSDKASLSPSVPPTFCSLLQQPSGLSLSALTCHGLDQVLEGCRYQPDKSLHINSDNEDAQGDFDRVDWRLLWEQTKASLGQRMGESEKSQSGKARSEARAKQENKRTAGIEGGERRWAWATAGTQHAHRVTGAGLNTANAHLTSYSCDSEDRSDEEGLTASHVSADGLWGTELGGASGSCSSVSAHLNTFPLESPHQRAPAERPFSPGCERTSAPPAPKALTHIHFKRSGYTSNIGHRDKEQVFATDANKRDLPKLPNASIPQIQWQKTAAPLSKRYENPPHTSHRHPEVELETVLPQDETCVEFLRCIMDPHSISLLQTDQQVATDLCPQKDQDNASVGLQRKDMGEDNVEVGNPICSDMLEIAVENEAPHKELPQIQWPLTSDTVTGWEKCITSEVLDSLQDQGNTQKPPNQITEGLSNKGPAPPLSPLTYATVQAPVKQPTKPYAQYTNTDSSNSHRPTHNMCSGPPSSISTQLSQSVSGHLNIVSSQCDSSRSIHGRDNSQKMNSSKVLNGQESTCSQQVRPTIHLSTLENMNHAQWCVVRAHCEQLEEMEALGHTEEMLLWQQPDMEFREYIHKLEKIMERKAQCVHSMRAHLQPYLTPHYSNQLHHQGEHSNNSVL